MTTHIFIYTFLCHMPSEMFLNYLSNLSHKNLKLQAIFEITSKYVKPDGVAAEIGHKILKDCFQK